VTIAVVQKSASSGGWTASFTASPTLPGNSTSGNLIILPWGHQQYDNHSTTVAATGYTGANAVNQTSNVAAAGCIYKAAAGAAETPSVVATTSGVAGSSFGVTGMIEVSGLDPTPYVSADSNTATGSSTSLAISTSNPLSEGAAFIVVVYSSNTTMAGGTWPPAGWTDFLTNLGNEYSSAYRIVASNAQISANMTISSAAQWASSITVWKAATASFRKTLSSIGGKVGARQLQG
jgi:hypothetical protein